MVEHHRELTTHEWPVRDASEAWARRRRQYLDWLSDGTGTLFTAAVQPSPELVGYAMLRMTPPGPTWALGAEMGEVESLAVVESARGAGVGAALLSACREALEKRGIEYWSVAVVESNTAGAGPGSLVHRLRSILPFVNRVSGGLLVVAGAYFTWYGIYELRIRDDPTAAGGPGRHW